MLRPKGKPQKIATEILKKKGVSIPASSKKEKLKKPLEPYLKH